MSHSTVQKDFYVFPVEKVYYVQFRDPVTRRLLSKKTTGFRRRTLAEKWAGNEYQRLCGEIGKTDLTFGEYAMRFYIDGCPHESERKANGETFGVKTRMDNRFRLVNYILPDIIANKRLCDITRPDVLDFRDRLIASLGFTRRAELSLIAFKNIINTALSRALITSDPAVKVRIKVKNGKRAATTVNNVKNILLKKHWPNETLWRAAMTAGIAGLRAGELCGLRWRSIIKENEEIHIARSISLYEGEKSTKSRKSRIAPYPEVLQLILEPHRGKPDEFVFSISKEKTKQPLSYYTLRSAMNRAMVRVIKADIKSREMAARNKTNVTKEEVKNEKSVPKITLHGLRHSINTALLEAGVNPELIKASFGWVHSETQEIYTHRDLYDLSPQRKATNNLFTGFTGE